MAKLTKNIIYTYIAADPGDPGSPGTAPVPGHSVQNCTTSSAGCRTYMVPVYGPCPSDGSTLITGLGQCLLGYARTNTCNEPTTTCTSTYIPPTSGTAATPARPPTPAETQQNFQEGWNSSAQSIVGLLPGKAALFKLQNGARGVLMGFATAPWAPRINTLQFGVMFADGTARVYENGVFGDSLGSFARMQEFIIGRTLDNYVVYMNKTDGATVARRRSPAPATVPVHLFSMLYYGGDTVLI